MSLYTELRTKVIGAPLDPLSEETRHNIAGGFFRLGGPGRRRHSWLIRLLHNQAALAIQRRLHLHGLQMVILPMKI